MITTNAEIKIKRVISENLFLLSIKLERYKQWVPGMFMQVSLGEKNASEPWLDGRSFSFASWGSERALILVRKEGIFTTTLVSRAKEGFVTSVRYPFGNFLLNSKNNKIFIAGGAGVSVFLSYLDYINLTDNAPEKVLLFHSAKRHSEGVKNIYTGAIPNNVSLKQFITNNNDSKYTGRPTIDSSMQLTSDISNFEYYVCGPPEFNLYWLEELKRFDVIPKLEHWEN